MSRPLKVNNTSPKSLKEMSDVEMNYIANKILAAYQSSVLGAITVNSNPGGYTSTGSFIDTKYPGAIGDHPASAVNSSTYDFRQNRQTGTEAHAGPMVWDAALDGIQQGSSSNLDNDINRRAFEIMSAGGLASYVLQSSAPVGGTWTNRATITDSSISGSATTKLWQKTSDTTPSVVRPLLWNSALSGIKEATDAEISLLAVQYHNWLMANNKGHYHASSTAPSTGTWVQVGAVFTDTRQQLVNTNYAGTYTGSYAGTYTGSYTGSYTGYYTGSYAGTYTGSYIRYYAGINYGTYTGSYAGSRNHTYAGAYAGAYTGSYAGSRNNSYTGTYSGATIQAAKEDISTIKLWLRTA